MNEQRLEPSKIRTPIQLLAAWLLGLILVNGSFLAAAATLQKPDWAPGWLVVASIANVPLFLVAIFLLQTKFRPEMQEDEYYAKYLDRRYSPATGKVEIVETKYPAMQVDGENAALEKLTFSPRATPGRKVRIEVNDLLPDFKGVMAALRQAGLKIGSTFGSTSSNPTLPRPLIVAIGSNVDVSTAQTVLSVVKNFGMDAVGFSDEAWEANNIYIGSYGYLEADPVSGERVVPLNAETLSKLLSPKLTTKSFQSLLRDRSINMTAQELLEKLG